VNGVEEGAGEGKEKGGGGGGGGEMKIEGKKKGQVRTVT
jgi:hypothetical protein